MKHNAKHIALFLYFISSGLVVAHQDRDLSVIDGKIIGLPEEYTPASFDYEKLSLSIGDKQLIFPQVIFNMLKYDASEDQSDDPKWKLRSHTYKFSASWHYNNIDDNWPPNMFIKITSSKDSSIIWLMIDMDRLEITSADLHTKDFGIVPINLDSSAKVLK